MTEVAFRKAGREDVALVLEFIRELADYEKMLDEVVATPELLEKWIFDIAGETLQKLAKR